MNWCNQNYLQNNIQPSYFTNDSVVSVSGLNITVDQVKQTIGIYEDDTADAYIQQLILSAEEIASNYIGTPITAVTRTDYYKSFANRFKLSARFTTTASDFVVRYYNNSDSVATWDSNNYIVDKTVEFPLIKVKNNIIFPEVSIYYDNPVSVTYTAGVPSELESPVIKRAIIGIVVELHKNKGITSNTNAKMLPISALNLLDYLKKIII